MNIVGLYIFSHNLIETDDFRERINHTKSLRKIELHNPITVLSVAHYINNTPSVYALKP